MTFKTGLLVVEPVHFWATACKKVRPMLSDRCLSCLSVCLSVCDVGVLWPNGWMDQYEIGTQVGLGTGHIVLGGDPDAPSAKGHRTQFSVHVRCGQMAGLIKMPLGM